MGLDCDPISVSEWQTHCPQWQVLPHNNSIVASSLFPFISPVGTEPIRYLKSIFNFMPNPNVSPLTEQCDYKCSRGGGWARQCGTPLHSAGHKVIKIKIGLNANWQLHCGSRAAEAGLAPCHLTPYTLHHTSKIFHIKMVYMPWISKCAMQWRYFYCLLPC